MIWATRLCCKRLIEGTRSLTASPLIELVSMLTPPIRSNQVREQRVESFNDSRTVLFEHGVPRWLRWAIVFVCVVAGALRLASAFGDLAIDEIWTWWVVRQSVHSMFDIFTLRHDNNHLLNTIVIYILGPAAPDILYRLPAACASCFSVIVAGWIARRRGGWTSVLTTSCLVGGSYLFILYGSEARGYSYAVLFAYLSWLFLLRTDERGRWEDAAGFSLCACFGFLGHLTFIYCFAGFIVWAFLRWPQRRSWMVPLAFISPTLLAACLYLYFIRGMAIGGGPETTLTSALISTLSLMVGGPLYDDGALVAAVVSVILCSAGIVHLWSTDRRLACSYLTTTIAAPAAVLLMTGHQLIYPRYFLVSIAFGLLVLGDLTAHWWRTSRMLGRSGLVCLFGLFLLCNANWVLALLNHGRGDYSNAMRWMANRSEQLPSSVSSDHDFRNGLIFAYYSDRLWSSEPPLRYGDQQSLRGRPTDWVIRHNFDGDPPFPTTISDPGGNAYRLERTFLHHSLTGWNWWIYRGAEKKLTQTPLE